MNALQEKLDFLIDKYAVDAKAVLTGTGSVEIDGKAVPLLPHRSERRFTELKNIVNNGTLVGVSVLRTARIVEKGTDLYEVLYRELDLCQWILQDSIRSVMAVENDSVINVIAVTEKGIVCTIEASATLAKGQEPIDKHEIISQRGIACDVVVDAQLKQDSIYLFTDKKEKYTDVDFELYGLSASDIAVVRAAFAVAQKKNYDELTAIDENVKKLVALVKKSAKSGKKEVM
ncbi:MAG: hypothetical protein ACI4RV_08705 [Eubacteriales bacterium]